MTSLSVWHEAGGSAANAGVQLTEIGESGLFGPEEFIAAIKPSGHGIFPPTTLVQIENTHNRLGGVIFPQDDVVRICAAARERGIATYLDGARLWNAAAANGKSVAELSAPFDMVMVSLSKGLGAPGGSMLAGSRADIGSAMRIRRMFGGAMRQIGFYAAAADYALDHNTSRLSEDHIKARLLASVLAKSSNIEIDPATVATNIVVFQLKDSAPDTERLVAQARMQGVLINAFAARTIRAVTHLDVSQEECTRAGEVLVSLAGR
jgi:threonine aldolase